MTYGSCILIIPKGTMADDIVWKYIHDEQPGLGWNVKPEFNDTSWLEGKTIIGPARCFVRTNISSREICLRKIFRVTGMPRNAFLNIAVYGDIDVWLNGRKILSSIDTLHRVFYWNYRLNITEHLKEDDDNLLAVYIKKGGGETYFDCELLFDEKDPEESSESLPTQEAGCYSYISCLADIFYGTSILKTLNRMDVIDRNRIILWVMGSRSINGYFEEGYSLLKQ